jgi:FdhD protein
LIVEEPLTIQLDGEVVATTMRTPGNDFELATGFCFTEGLLAGAAVSGVRYCADSSAVDSHFNIVTVETGGAAPPPTPRLGNVSSSCGWCGSEQLDALCARLAPLPAAPPPDLAMLASLPERVLTDQGLFASTGAVHAAACVDADGAVLIVREDVGRHNAVDKVIGAMLLSAGDGDDGDSGDGGDGGNGGDGALAGAPMAHGLGLFVSGRASIEMVQKAWAAGFSWLLAVSAPTALAVDAARRADLFLAGFGRGDTYNVYSPERISS